MYRFLLTHLGYTCRNFNVLLENEEWIFISLGNMSPVLFIAVDRKDKGFYLWETDNFWPLTPLSFLVYPHSETHLCGGFILSSLPFYVGRGNVCLWYEGWVGGIFLILNVFWTHKLEVTSILKMLLPCCWCTMLSKPFWYFHCGNSLNTENLNKPAECKS